jgi:hypothetical protein
MLTVANVTIKALTRSAAPTINCRIAVPQVDPRSSCPAQPRRSLHRR